MTYFSAADIKGKRNMKKKKIGAAEFSRSHKIIFISIIGVMCLLICGCLGFGIRHQVFTDAFATGNALTDLVLMEFLTMLFAFSVFDTYSKNRQDLVFSLLIVVDYLMLFFSTLSYSVYGLTGKADLHRVTDSISYMLCFVSFAALWKYQSFFYEKTRTVKISTCIIYSMALLYAVFSVVNIFVPVLFRIDANGYYDMRFPDYVTTLIGGLMIVTMYINIHFSDLTPKKKIALASYEIAPAAIILISIGIDVSSADIYLPCAGDASMIFPLFIIFFNIYLEQKNEIARSEVEQIRMETSLVLSQIQPHFLYNCLSSIAALCEEEPQLAGKATTTFSDYLRENMNYIGSEVPISFAEEMRHVESYVWLEKLRFSDRVNVLYDISCSDFSLPALTVQPLVENAIKHGICKGRGGGTVTVASREDGKAYTVTIADDGIGFEPSDVAKDGKPHIGMESVRKRLQSMVGGSMKVASAPGKGTTVTITVPKNGG